MKSIALALGIVLACGCGDDGGGGGGDADAGDNEDASADPDADLTTTIRVTALDEAGAVEVGVQVLFVAADGSLVLDTVTDSAGQASAEMLPGGSVTLIRPAGGDFFGVTTFLDPPPDADIVSRAFVSEAFTPVNISWPQAANANGYRVFADCPFDSPTTGTGIQTSDLTIALDVATHCADNFTVLIKAENNLGLAPQTLFASGQSAPTVALAGAYDNVQSVAVAVAGVPADLSGPPSIIGGAWFARDRLSTEFLSTTGAVLDAGGMGTFTAALGAGRTFQMLMTAPTVSQTRIERLEPGTSNHSVNLDGEMLPWIIGTAELDLATRELAWLEQDPLGSTATAPGLAMAQLEYRRSPLSIRWNVIAPGSRLVDGAIADQKVLRLPDLPGELTFEPLATDTGGLDIITLFAVDPGAVNGVYEILEGHRGRLDLFEVEALTRITIEVGN